MYLQENQMEQKNLDDFECKYIRQCGGDKDVHVPSDPTSRIPHDWFERFMASLSETDEKKEDRFVTKEDNIEGGKSLRESKNDKKEKHQKPQLSFVRLALTAIKDSPCKRLTFREICEYIMEKYPYYQGKIGPGLKQHLSNLLSRIEFFVKSARRSTDKNCTYWELDASIENYIIDPASGNVCRWRNFGVGQPASNLVYASLHQQSTPGSTVQHQRPRLSLVALAMIALKESPCKRLELNEVCEYIMKNYPHFQGKINHTWKENFARTLSEEKIFVKTTRRLADKEERTYWMLDSSVEDYVIYKSRIDPPALDAANGGLSQQCTPASPTTTTKQHCPGILSVISDETAHQSCTAARLLPTVSIVLPPEPLQMDSATVGLPPTSNNPPFYLHCTDVFSVNDGDDVLGAIH